MSTEQSAGRAPTIRDVAREAGVSKSLVSLVFNGGDNVGPERRERVLRAAEQLGYRPNLVAKSLAARKPDFIAVLMSNLSNPLFAEILGAARARLSAAGRRTMILSAVTEGPDGEPMLDRENLDVLHGLRPSAILAIGTIPDLNDLADLTGTLPTVVASATERAGGSVFVVRSDDFAGVELVLDHLVAEGLREIAFVGGDGGDVSAARERAYREGMTRHGLADLVRVIRADFTEESGRRAARELVEGGRIPEAVVAVNDLAAMGAMAGLEEAGVRVPQECRVTGYDDTSLSAIPRISLTSVDPDNRRIGETAADALLDAAGPFAEPSEMLVAPRLVVRDSSGGGQVGVARHL
ncbi:LacI family DNA-binding transcriptional regulator [Leucobacter tardus]|uniref:LacI family DNA-binding transcriptional regulator n=1 Tax=Leucobacter tardus TaxID=501483 RepID=A0A939TUA3_9MICO|nr:LacI family DNA-binding transcriptional regulator [Leucobacter tardus]MBO2989535.1 LacI family DNA-binding transcriptional regulator [Leucobacter tardus]